MERLNNRERAMAEFATNCVQHAILSGFEHEEFMRVMNVAWLVITSERESADSATASQEKNSEQ
jgi:hypothetical protein